MSELHDKIAGALRSDHVKKTLIDELKESVEFKSWVIKVLSDETERIDGERPRIYQKAYWTQSAVFGPAIAVAIVLGGLTGLSWADVFKPATLAHDLLGTDDRIVSLFEGKTTSASSGKVREILDAQLSAIMTDASAPEKTANIKVAIQKAAAERPFLIFHGWRALNVVPDDAEFPEDCRVQLAKIETIREQTISTLNDSGIWKGPTSSTKPTWTAKSANSQARSVLEDLSVQEKRIRKECIAGLGNPNATFSFYADLTRDKIGVLLRVLKYKKGSPGLHAVNQQDSQALAAKLTSVSLNGPDGSMEYVDLKLKFTDDGVLEAAIDKEMSSISNENDPIFHLIVTLDKSKIKEEIEGLGFVVGSVVQLNGADVKQPLPSN